MFARSLFSVRSLIGSLLLLAAVSVLFAHQLFGESGLFGPRDRLRIGAYEGDVGALQWIAQEQGFYDKVGLDVELKGFPSGQAATKALGENSIDVATASEFVVASLGFSDVSLRVIANICHYRNKGIVARRDRGIAAASGLKGKKIGVTVPSGSEYAMHVFLALNDIDVGDVQVVNVPAPKMVETLVQGEVDAVSTWEPHVRNAGMQLGANGLTFEGKGFDTYLLLVTQDKAAQEKPRAMRKLLRAMTMAEDWLRTHPEEAKAYVVRRFKVEADYVANLWPNMNFTVNLPQEMLPAMDGEAQWLNKRKSSPAAAIPDFDRFIWAEGLRAVRPGAVTLFSQAR